MGVIILLLAIVAFFAVMVQWLAKKGLARIEKYEQRKREASNPYINYHKNKIANEISHGEYLEWMIKNDIPGAPKDKLKFAEDVSADKKIERLMR